MQMMLSSLSTATCSTLLLSAPNTLQEDGSIPSWGWDSRNWEAPFTYCLGDFPGVLATTPGLCGIGLQSPHWGTKSLWRMVLPHTKGIHDTALSDSLHVSLHLPSPKQVSPHPPVSWISSIFRGQANHSQRVLAPLPDTAILTFCRGQPRYDCTTGTQTHMCTHWHTDCKDTPFPATLAAPTFVLTSLLPGSLLPKHTHLHTQGHGHLTAVVFLVSRQKEPKIL